MIVLVTGGCGFIGHHVVRDLVSRGHGVHVLDVGDRPAINWSEVESLVGPDHVHRGDVRSWRDVETILRDHPIDLVLHLAAQSHVDRSVRDPSGTVDTNVVGTQVVSSACARHGVPLLYCSTDEVYGDAMDTGSMVLHTEDSPLHPSSPYSAGKAGGELVVQAAGRTHGLRWAITRGTNAWGPGQYPEKLVPIVVQSIRDGTPVPLHGGGDQIRQWVAVEEFAEALVVTGEALADDHPQVVGRVFNIAGPVLVSVRDLTEAIATSMGVGDPSSAWETVADRPGQDRAYCVSGDRLATVLGVRPERSILDPVEINQLVEAYPMTGITVDAADYGVAV